MDQGTVERFLAGFQVQPNGCWQWQKSFKPKGYGQFTADKPERRNWPAHRLSYLLHKGELPNLPLTLDHLCRNRGCVNPDHLEVVTQGENARRGTVWKMRGRTTCPQGHPKTPENVYTGFDKRRNRVIHVCRPCNRVQQYLRWYKERSAALGLEEAA